MLQQETRHHIRELELKCLHPFRAGLGDPRVIINKARQYGKSAECAQVDRLFLGLALYVWGNEKVGTKRLSLRLRPEYAALSRYLFDEDASLNEPSTSIKKLLDINHPDMAYLLRHQRHPFSWSPDDDICKAFSNTCLTNPDALRLAITEDIGHEIIIRHAVDVCAAYNTLEATKAWNKILFYTYLDERINRGMSVDEFLKEIPPGHWLWTRIPITKEFIGSLPPAKRFHFLWTCTEKIPVTQAEVKQMIFPLINKPQYADGIVTLLEKYENREEKYKAIANVLCNKHHALNGHINRLNTIYTPDIIEFITKQWPEDQAKQILCKLLDHLYRTAPHGARPLILKAYTQIAKGGVDND